MNTLLIILGIFIFVFSGPLVIDVFYNHKYTISVINPSHGYTLELIIPPQFV